MKKKFLAWLLISLMLMIVIMLPVIALAESGSIDATPLTGLWTAIAVSIIGVLTVLTTILIRRVVAPLWNNVIRPWLDDRHMLDMVDAAVKYAESKLGRFTGEQKWVLARSWLASLGWDVNSEAVIAALKAAHYQLNLEMIKAGLKEPPIEPSE